MFSDLLPIYPLLVPFLLVMFRLLGLFAFVPFFSNTNIPGNVRVLLGLAMTVCIWNIVPKVGTGALPATLPALIVAVAGELAIGLFIGMLVAALFAGIAMGAHMISQQMGLSLAALYDPAFEDQSTVIEQVAFWIALVVFLSMGGHREIINAVVYSYQKVPIGAPVAFGGGAGGVGGVGLSPEVLLNTVIGAMDASFHAAARVAMPALVAFFIATLTSGLMSRSMPQLNLMTVGIAVHLLVGFVMVGVGLAGWALVAQNGFTDLFNVLGRILSG